MRVLLSKSSIPIVCVITRVRGVRGSRERTALIDRLSAAAVAGASMIQVRERQMDDRAHVGFARDLVEAVAATTCLVTINDRPDIALASGAHGVHLKADGVTAADVRGATGKDLVLGRSVHSVAEAVDAEESGGYSYLLFGTVFPSASKSAGHLTAGVEAMHEVCARVSIPVLAIGGMTAANADEVARAGAAGVAAISFFTDADDMAEAVSSLRRSLTHHSRRSKLLEDD